jgi:ubiquinone/menaquinone biosynthesis C-methylase UbiE
VTVYDQHASFYVDFVDAQLSSSDGMPGTALARLESLLGDRLQGARVCDLACGEGYLSRHLAAAGAAAVTGIDISAELIAIARQRTADARVTFQVDDAQVLGSLGDRSFDVAVSQLALMDIPDHVAMFRATRRVLRDGGVFAFSILHPCFHAPFREPDDSPYLDGDDGQPTARVIRRYATEGHWSSGGTGVRGRVGAYHRTLSTLVNDLLAAGFGIEALDEPVVPGGGLWAEVPPVLIVVATAA